MATHSSNLAWRFPWTEGPGGLQSMGLQRVGRNSATNTFTFKSKACLDYDMVIHCILVLEILSLLEFPMKQTLGQAWVQAVHWKLQETSAGVSRAGPRNRAGSVKGLVGDQGAVWRGSSGSWCETHAWESPYLRAGEVTYPLLTGGRRGACGLLPGQPAAHAQRGTNRTAAIKRWSKQGFPEAIELLLKILRECCKIQISGQRAEN